MIMPCATVVSGCFQTSKPKRQRAKLKSSKPCYRCTVTTECCERGGDRSTSCRQASAHRALDLFGGGVFLIVLEHWLMDKLLKSMMMMMFITIFAGD